MTSRAPGAESATTADETHERLPEVGGACAVEEEARGEIAVVEELDELLPDERLQRQFVVHPQPTDCMHEERLRDDLF